MKIIKLSNNEKKKLNKIRRKHQEAFEEEYNKLLNKMIRSRKMGLKKWK